MTFKDLPEDKQKEVASILKRKDRGGATVSLSAYFRSEAGKRLIFREKERTKAASAITDG